MANSAVKEGNTERNKRQSCRVDKNRLFEIALQGIKNNKKPQDPSVQFLEDQKSRKLEETSNELISHAKSIPKSCHSVDQDEDLSDSNMQTFRRSKSYDNSRSAEYDMNPGHHYNTQKSSKFSNNSKANDHNSSYKQFKSYDICQEKHLPSNDKSCEDHMQISSNSEHQNDDSHSFILRMCKPVRHRNDSNDKHMNVKYDDHNEKKTDSNFSNTDSHIVSSPKTVKPNSNFNRSYSSEGNSNFKRFSYHQSQDHHSYSISKRRFHPNQQHDFQKVSCNKKFNQNVEHKESNTGHIDQNTKVDDREKDSFSYRNLNLENDFEDDNIEIKHQRICFESDEPLGNSSKNKNNLKITFHTVPNSVTNASSASNIQVSPTSNRSTSSVSSISVSPVSNVSSVCFTQTYSNEECINTTISTVETSPNLTLSNMFGDKSSINGTALPCSNDDIIPPPIEPFSTSDKLCSSAEKNRALLQNSESQSTEEDLSRDEAFLFLPDSVHVEAISDFIFKIVKERSVPFTVADKVVNDLQRLFKNHFEGNVIDYYGSYYTDLAITTSDINLVIKADVSVRNSFMYEIYKILLNELEKYHVLPYEEGTNPRKSKVNFTHPVTGINCELTYLGQNRERYFKMGKFLKSMCDMDERVKPLIIVAKVWAESFNINEVEDGKLHPIGFTLSIIHFLQHCEDPVLPIFCEEQNIKDMKEDLYGNDLSVGALWLSFLKYYAFKFNWQEDILTVTSVNRVSKKSKQWENFWIAIEDPFTGKNIALSVINKDVADHIKSCFKHSYNYFLSGRKNCPYSESDENLSSIESSSSQFEFSFNDCAIEQYEDICERCEEIDDLCDECKKKIYVQPLASIPKMTDDFLKVVKKALLTVYNKYILSDKEVEERKQFVKKLENDIRKIYREAQMSLFGSSANGFGFKKSDLDICMTFKSKEKFDAFAVLRSLRRLLQKNKDFINVIAIFNAQIPILKFQYEPRGWRGDISLNNVLAIHNSELLHTYSLIDERSKILGCALKLIAKKAIIADVTEKALSSYSYLIMVIHFLQQTDPPVLPVLQDSQFRVNHELDDIVDNCNVWFFREVDDIKKIFKMENCAPVEQLFLDLLDYYCSFDYDHVITIRQKEILTLSCCEKMRSARLFNIQDPFLVNKNLGCVVSPSKAQETKSIFNRARLLFRIPKKELPDDLEDHFFTTMSLTGRIQKEALCDNCGKFGHDKDSCNQSFPLKNNFFKYRPRQYQYVNRNNIFKKKQMNRPYIREKLY